jgi:serine/threonine protein phosphatase 1
MKKTYVIGDVHGCIKTLRALHSKLEPDSNVYCAGDLVDKGYSSLEVIDFCIENDIKVVKGNHEYLYEVNINKHLQGKNIRNGRWYRVWGGDRTIKSYRYKRKKLKEHLEYINNLPYYMEVNCKGINYFITHGFGLPYYDKRDEEEYQRPMMSNRLNNKYYDISKVDELSIHNVVNIFGHDADDEVRKHELYCCVDTACVYGNVLTAIELGTDNLIQQKVLDDVDYY